MFFIQPCTTMEMPIHSVQARTTQNRKAKQQSSELKGFL